MKNKKKFWIIGLVFCVLIVASLFSPISNVAANEGDYVIPNPYYDYVIPNPYYDYVIPNPYYDYVMPNPYYDLINYAYLPIWIAKNHIS